MDAIFGCFGRLKKRNQGRCGKSFEVIGRVVGNGAVRMCQGGL